MNVIGISTRLAWDGTWHPYLVVLSIDGRIVSTLVALPRDRRYLSPPVHHLYGDLTKGEEPAVVGIALASLLRGRRVTTHRENQGIDLIGSLGLEYVDGPIDGMGENAFAQIEAVFERQKEKTAP